MWKTVQQLPAYGAQGVLDSAGHMGPGAVVLHDGTRRGHAETPSVDGGTEDGGFHSTAVLYNDAGV